MRTTPLFIVSLAIALSAATAVAQDVATVSEPAPDFTLVDQAGNSHTLSQYLGSIVVLEWTNPECPFVQRSYNSRNMQNTAASFAGQVVWLAVDSTHFNDADVNIAWMIAQEFDYPTLQDRDGTVGHLYGARTTPHMFVVDAEGVLRYAGAFHDDSHGDQSDVENYVANAITALQNGTEPARSQTDPWGCTVKYPEEDE